jgi:uncharacterized protein (TIGR02722 family)
MGGIAMQFCLKTAKILGLITVCFVWACSTTTTVLDVNKPMYMNEKFGYSDLKTVTEKMISSILTNPPISNRNDRPIAIVYGITNRTDEHLDTMALSEKIQTGLTQSGKLRFVNKEARNNIEKEIAYQGGGMVTPQTKIKLGKQVGAEYLISGAISSITAEEGRGIRLTEKKVKYYKINLELTDLNTNIIEWSDEQEFARLVAEPFIGW